MMKKLQKLGKALMLPVAALPICGILMGLGYAIAPGVMGVPGAATSGALYNIGFLLVKEASKFASKIMIASPKKEVDAKRIMGVMSMGAKKGDTVKLTIEGADEAEAAASLEKFLQDNL